MNMAAQASQKAQSSRKIRVGALQWHIRTQGSGPVCLLIHGTGASVHSWDKLAPLLAAHYTVVMIDLPGHADTVTPADADLTLQGMAAALFEFIEHENLHPELIVGHSAGAAIMLELCLEHPHCAKKLACINAAVIPLGGLAGYLFLPLARLSAASAWMPRFFSFRARNDSNVKKLLDSTGSVVDPESFRRYAELFSDPAHVSGVLRMMANWHLEKLNARLGQIQQPVKLIAASDDKTIPLRDIYKLRQLLPAEQVKVYVVNGGGHLLHEEDPSSVARIILDTVAP